MSEEIQTSRMSRICARCKGGKPYSTAKICGPCYREERRGKGFGLGVGLKLTVRKLSKDQRAIFKAIISGRSRSRQNDLDALWLIQQATERGELEKELIWWTTPPDQEPPHKTTSLGLMICYAPGNIQ